MPPSLIEQLRARGCVLPDYDGGGLLNVAATVLDVFGAREPADPRPLRELDPALTRGVRQIVLVLADGLGLAQLRALCANGDTPFIASVLERAGRRERAQLVEATTIFPSTTAAAITTLHTARTPQEHGNMAYFVWLDEFSQVTQMLRWGPAVNRRGSFFDDARLDPLDYVKVGSIYPRLRARGVRSHIVQPEPFRLEAMDRMHAIGAEYAGYSLPSTMSVWLRSITQLNTERSYVYAYWAGIDSVAHLYGPQSAEHATEAALFDKALERALAVGTPQDTLVILTADHGHAFTDPQKLIDLEGDLTLRDLLRNPVAGEPRLAFLHTGQPERVKQHLERRHPNTFFFIDREEAIAAGLFGRGDPEIVRQRVGEVLAMLGGDRAASIVKVDGKIFHHRGSHGGMSPEEMRIPVLAWRA